MSRLRRGQCKRPVYEVCRGRDGCAKGIGCLALPLVQMNRSVDLGAQEIGRHLLIVRARGLFKFRFCHKAAHGALVQRNCIVKHKSATLVQHG